VDLGGIAKGYGIDLAAEALLRAGVEAALVDIGGDIRAIGRPGPERTWRIKVRSPAADTKEVVLEIASGAVATSGDYARGFRIGQRWFSHIIDPHTGRPAPSSASVTVVAADATLADGLATGLSVMGPGKGIPLVDSLPGVECMMVVRDKAGGLSERFSAGFRSMISE